MFGGHAMYCDGTVFALVASDALYLKADDHNRADFERSGLSAFHPFGDERMVMQYYQAPPEIFEDVEALRRWGGGAVAAGRRGQAKKPKKKSAPLAEGDFAQMRRGQGLATSCVRPSGRWQRGKAFVVVTAEVGRHAVASNGHSIRPVLIDATTAVSP